MIAGIVLGGYAYNKQISIPKCLSCLGLEPVSDLEFTFELNSGGEHPTWVRENLKKKVVFIDFSYKVGCPGCDEMLPVVESLNESYGGQVEFFVIYLDLEEEQIPVWLDYDIQNKKGAPTFIIITLNQDEQGNIRPYFGEVVGKVSENELSEYLDDAVALHLTYFYKYK